MADHFHDPKKCHAKPAGDYCQTCGGRVDGWVEKVSPFLVVPTALILYLLLAVFGGC